jgi:glycosyltransferase involved in cell wall biosynthesis
VVHFLDGEPGPHLIHGFALWAGAATSASRALNMGGTAAVPVASAYATRLYEVAAMQPGIRSHHGLAHKLHYAVRLQWTRWVEDLLEGRGYARSKLVLVNYDSVERILEDAYGARLNIRRVPYASANAFEDDDDDDRIEPRTTVGAPPRILSVSRHDPRKGVDVLLLALGRLAAEGLDFSATLVGPGRLLQAHRRLAADLGLAERVSIPGRVDDVAPYFERADVFVLPSLAESSGSVSVLEALRAGIAIVASACDGVPEDLTDGVDALLVEPDDPSALAGALRALLTDRARRGQLGANGRRTHDQRFSADRFVAAIGDVYCELERSAAMAARTPSAT